VSASGAVMARALNPVFGLGRIVVFAAQATSRGLRPPFTYGPELVGEFQTIVRACILPLLLVSVALSFGPAGVQAGGFFGLFGAYDRLGALWQLVVTRFFGPMTTAVVIAGVAGTAICADLGARVVREEVAALRVLGVDTLKNLVAPRLFLLTACAMLFNGFALIGGMVGAILVLVQNGQPIGPFMASFFGSASTVEFLGSFIKAGLYGAVIATVSCYKGLNASGGSEGVGKAVNQAVVISFLSIAVVDYLFTQFLLATNPVLSVPRG
jgi:phospholipid/cholesterol/gamma-HCH transport system permease protein